MRTYEVKLTRTLDQECTVEVEAPNARLAEMLAMELFWDDEGLPWEKVWNTDITAKVEGE